MQNNRSADQNDHFKAIEFDIEYYQSLFDDDTLSEDLKRQFLETLWAIMVQFVDLGFGIESSQIVAATASKKPLNCPANDPNKARLLAHSFATSAQKKDQTSQEKESV